MKTNNVECEWTFGRLSDGTVYHISFVLHGIPMNERRLYSDQLEASAVVDLPQDVAEIVPRVGASGPIVDGACIVWD